MHPNSNPLAPGRTRRRATVLVALVAPLAFIAACSSSSSGGDTPSTAAPTTTAATTTTEVDGDAAGAAFQDLVDDAASAIDDENADRDDFATDNDLDGAIESAAGLQGELEDFQAGLADLEVPEDAQDAVDELDQATADYVDALAAYEDVRDIPDYNDALDDESDAVGSWRDAVSAVADALGVDGLGSSTGSGDPEEPTSSSTAAGPITGDGSEYCLQEGDLPDGFLPLTGDDNVSTALSYTFDDGPEADYADALVASWMVLPEGGAGPEDLTADCLIHIFDSVESAEGFYDTWTADYGADSYPTPEEADVAAGAPGEDPHAYTTLVGDRPNTTQIFRYENAVVSVGISGTPDNQFDTLLEATNELAQTIAGRLEAAA